MKPLAAATLVAVAVASFAAADISHEGLGHGAGCLLAGGTLRLVSSTFADCTVHARLVDGGGPAGGIVAALLAWWWARLVSPQWPMLRVFLILVFAFAAFWNFGYLIKSGLTNEGDWAFVIAGLKPLLFWRAVITGLGILLYALSIRACVGLLRGHAPAKVGEDALAICALGYAAAIAIACAAASFDPRGPYTVWHDALPASVGAVGLPWAGWVLHRRAPGATVAVAASWPWLGAGVVVGAAFIAILGPGLRFA